MENIDQSSTPESATDIAKRICPKTRIFSGGEVQLFATSEQFETLVMTLVANRTKRLLVALDGMDLGCSEPGFRGFQNGYGEESAGNELQAAREELVALVGHVAAVEDEDDDLPPSSPQGT